MVLEALEVIGYCLVAPTATPCWLVASWGFWSCCIVKEVFVLLGKVVFGSRNAQ